MCVYWVLGYTTHFYTMTHGYDVSIVHDGAVSPIVEWSWAMGVARKLIFDNDCPQPVCRVTSDIKDGYDDAQPTHDHYGSSEV